MFRIIHELETLSEEQRKQYAADASVYFGLDPGLGGLDFIWMNHESGFRKLVLYARRGITDILRDKKKINVTALTQAPVNGSLVTTATGQDVDGRQEIAVGSMYIEGLRERALDDAIMTSQTRALRRLTLQFVGGGILDESEVGGVTVHSAGGGVSPTLQPSVAPSNAPGKDITGWVSYPEHVTTNLATGETTFHQTETREAFIKRLNENEPKRKLARRSKTTVDFGVSEPPPTSAQTPAQTPDIQPVIKGVVNPITPEGPILSPQIHADISADIRPARKKPSLAEIMPYKQRMFSVIRTLEEEAKFEAKPNLGNQEKMRLLANKKFNETFADVREMSVEQWSEFVTDLENYHAANGSLATVNYIEAA